MQAQVAIILNQCGFINVETEKKIETARNKVEIDVYGEELINNRKITVLCECKFWNKKIPQDTIHSFRTVMNDYGANTGYIISKKGFQLGAFQAVKNTNVLLRSWEDFQNDFEKQWFDRYMIREMDRQLDPFFTYSEPFLPDWFDSLSEIGKQNYFNLKSQYDDLGQLLFVLFTPWARINNNIPLPVLPLSNIALSNILSKDNVKIPNELLKITSYREFLEVAIKYGKQAISKFNEIRDNSLTNTSE
ncbi:restriction endonuclease [Legionella sp. WA2024007413]